MNLALYAIWLFGLAYIVGFSQITLPLRRALRFIASEKWRCAHCGAIRVGVGDHPREAILSCEACGISHAKMIWRHQSERHTLGFFLDGIECAACFSFHLGWVIDLLAPRVFDTVTLNQLVGEPRASHALLAAILAAGCSAIIGHLTGIMKAGS